MQTPPTLTHAHLSALLDHSGEQQSLDQNQQHTSYISCDLGKLCEKIILDQLKILTIIHIQKEEDNNVWKDNMSIATNKADLGKVFAEWQNGDERCACVLSVISDDW